MHDLTHLWCLECLQYLRMAQGVQCLMQTIMAIVWERFHMKVTGRHNGLKLVLGFERYLI
jgi:hypothetical protein